MKFVEVKKDKRGEYFVVRAILKVKTKTGKVKEYTVKQTPKSLTNLKREWKLTKTQLVSMLKNTNPDDWLLRIKSHFDGSVDSVVPVEEDFREMTHEDLEWVLRQLEIGYNGYEYVQDENVVEVWSLALGTFLLKPKNDIVEFVLPKEVLTAMIAYSI